MPKQRITKDMVVTAAFELARDGGMENVLVKNIADKLQCSVQPVYCYCHNMEGLKQEVVNHTETFFRKYLEEHLDKDHLFESMGTTHAMFAKEYPALYRLYFLRKREGVHSIKDIYTAETNPEVPKFISHALNIPIEQAEQLHLNMMIYNTGISFILTTLGKDTDIHQITKLLSHAKEAFTQWTLTTDMKEDTE